jgi:hypothetical protein
LRLAVERKLSKVLTAELRGTEVKLPLAGETESRLTLKGAKITENWLQLALAPSTAP